MTTESVDGATAGRVAGYGESVAARELAEAFDRLQRERTLTRTERVVLSAMAARITAGVLPGPEALLEADSDPETVARTLSELFPEQS